APLLAELGIPWTLFVVTGWADGCHPFGEDVLLGWRDIERLAQQGATIASHSVTHPNFARLDREGAMQELVESRQTLAARVGICTTEFAIPMGQSHDWTDVAHTAALAAGYQTVYAQSVQRRHPRTVARTFVTRFDGSRLFRAALRGSYDGWEEWV
ncbi:MAG TPA: polysaccharide deacetylase family protein, partial [Dehalococcoidia bacterium]|nr:polysaccharide deacetylase family protein [Dehalococcoidia bacterium]